MEVERQRMHVETLRTNAERERQLIETQRSSRTVLWVAVGFGAIGLLAMLFMPLVQLRTINRIAEVATQRAPAANTDVSGYRWAASSAAFVAHPMKTYR